MLDNLEKISKIVFAGVASTVIATAGLRIEWDKLGLEKDSWCFTHSDKAESALLRKSESIPDLLIKKYSERCDVSILEATRELNFEKAVVDASVQSEFAVMTKPVDGDGDGDGGTDIDTASNDVLNDKDGVGKTELRGFVALGRTAPTAHSHVNFDYYADEEPAIEEGSTARVPEINAELKARWSVNLRQNTNSTLNGFNPVVSVIYEGECVRVIGEPKALRRQYWALVTPSDCDNNKQ